MKKRLFAGLLALALCLGVLPSSWLISWNKKRKEEHNPDGISGRLQE